jgi:hypothetical protein
MLSRAMARVVLDAVRADAEGTGRNFGGVLTRLASESEAR